LSKFNRFHGSNCASTTNYQNGKLSCTDLTPSASATVTNITTDAETISSVSDLQPGDVFTVSGTSKLGANTLFTISGPSFYQVSQSVIHSFSLI
jgi:hypothetical protein